MACDASHTGRAMKQYEAALSVTHLPAHAGFVREEPVGTKRGATAICVHNAREHNLKSLDVEIPRGKFTVITGVSGSGKSTLAFDILFNEGQRRYLESLNAYARQFVQSATRPDVDAIFGIPPTVAIEQRTSRGGRKSTVATLTEIYHFLRLLYVKLGTQYCPDCDVPIEPQTIDSIVANIFRNHRGAARRPARAARRRPQRRLHRPRQVGSRQGLQTLARRWRNAADRTMAEARAFHRAHDRAAGRGSPGHPRERAHAADGAHDRPRLRQRRRSSRRRPRSTRARGTEARGTGGCDDPVGLFGQACVSLVRAQLSGARSATLLVQFQARLVRGMLWHRLADRRSGVGRGTPENRRRRSCARLVARMARNRRAVSRVQRPAAEPASARGALSRQIDCGADRAARVGARAAFRLDLRCGPGSRNRPRHPARVAQSARIPGTGRPFVSRARPRGAHALRRGSAAHPARGPARIESPRRVLHPRRADDRPARARQPRAPGHAGSASAQGQYARRRRARRGDDSPRRPRHRPRTGRRQTRGRIDRARHGGRSRARTAVDHRTLPRESAASSALRHAARESREPGGQDRPCLPAQPEERRRAPAARAADRRDGRIRVGQIDARARRAPCQSRAASGRQAPPEGAAGPRLPRDRGMGKPRLRAGSRSDADREDAALLPGDVRRLLGCRAPPVRGSARSAHARLHRRAVFHSIRAAGGARPAKARACSASR